MTLPMQITGVEIRQTPNGLYCLNDLHQAAGGEKTHQITNWLRNDQTKALIEEMQTSDMRFGVENHWKLFMVVQNAALMSAKYWCTTTRLGSALNSIYWSLKPLCEWFTVNR